MLTAADIILLIATIFFPPIVGVRSGCGADLLINICLTLLGVIPGHVHAFYLEYIYCERRDTGASGHAPGVYSKNILTGGRGKGYVPAPASVPQYENGIGQGAPQYGIANNGAQYGTVPVQGKPPAY